MKRLLSLLLLAVALPLGSVHAQSAPVKILVFPLKNLYGEVKYDSLAWTYADSLVSYLNHRPNASASYAIVSMDDIRDQMIALNIDVRAPSYETDIWKIAKALGAKKIIWGTYLVKYDKANLEIKIIDVKTLMPDRVNIADKLRVGYADALSTVVAAGDKLVPGLKP
ncbi:MAG: hypothetical protein JST22_06400 [Bacteroidetes bacterium]|nr:hypothetical protein [Bacteroidota bacterium]